MLQESDSCKVRGEFSTCIHMCVMKYRQYASYFSYQWYNPVFCIEYYYIFDQPIVILHTSLMSFKLSNEVRSRLHIGRHLPDDILVISGLEQGHIFKSSEHSFDSFCRCPHTQSTGGNTQQSDCSLDTKNFSFLRLCCRLSSHLSYRSPHCGIISASSSTKWK